MLEKSKLIFDVGSINIKANIKLSGKEIEKYPRNIFTIIIVWMVIQELPIEVLLFSSKERHISKLKKGETFWLHRFTTFYPLGLNEKHEHLYQHTQYMSQTIRYEGFFQYIFFGDLDQFQFYQLLKYQFIQVSLLIYVCVCIYLDVFKILGEGTFILIQCLLLHLEVFLFIIL